MIGLIVLVIIFLVIYSIKRFLDNYGKFLPSSLLIMFIQRVREIESIGDGKVIINVDGDYHNIILVRGGDVIDSIAVNIGGNRIYSGVVKGDKADWTDIILPMTLPIGSNMDKIDEIRELEDKLVGEIMEIIVRYKN